MPAVALAVAWTSWSFAAVPLPPSHCQAGEKSSCLSWGSSRLPPGHTQPPGLLPLGGRLPPLLREAPFKGPSALSWGPSHPAVGRVPPSPGTLHPLSGASTRGSFPNSLVCPELLCMEGRGVQRSGHSPPSTSHPWAPTCIPRPLLPPLTHTPVGTLTPPGPPGPPGSQAPCQNCQAPPGALGSLPEAWRGDEAFRDSHVPTPSPCQVKAGLCPIPRLPAVTASGRGARSKPTPRSS